MEYLCRCSYCKRMGTKEDVEEHEKTCIQRKCEFKKIKTTFLTRGYILSQECTHTENTSSICWGVGDKFCPLTENKCEENGNE